MKRMIDSEKVNNYNVSVSKEARIRTEMSQKQLFKN